MCGIAGIFDHGAGLPVEADVLQRMTHAMAHRGPDDTGFYCRDNLGMGVRRLSIIDVRGGQQPMTNEDGSVVVVFNGEIYNHRSLRERLRDRGHTLTTVSDTEVIPHLYEDHGLDFVDHLRGMFGLALWDAARQRLVLARDRLGIKPLYYADDGGRLVFGSEIKAILHHPMCDAAVDPEALALYLALRYVPAPRTMFRGIRSLPPGCMLTVQSSVTRLHRYWNLRIAGSGPPRSDIEYEEELAWLLRDAVSSHLQSDVPFGSFLSGGIDSSLVTALMSEVLAQPVKTFSIGFTSRGRTRGELPYARTVARAFQTDHSEVLMSGKDFVDATERVVWHLDQPIGDAASVASLRLSEFAGERVKMVMSGEGGDELFGGYARHVAERFAFILQFVPANARRMLFSRMRSAARSRRTRIALHALGTVDPLERLVNWFPLFNDDMRAELLVPQLAAAVGDAHPEAVFRSTLDRAGTGDVLNRMLYCDTSLWLPDLLLLRGDKMSMAASVELRVPLLDHKVVEFAGRLPRSLKVRGFQRKVLLRRIGAKILPTEILERRKEGFPLPLADWWRDEARELLEDTLAPSAIRTRGLFDARYVSRLVEQHVSGLDHSLQLWGLVSLELWLRQFVDRGVGVDDPSQRHGADQPHGVG